MTLNAFAISSLIFVMCLVGKGIAGPNVTINMPYLYWHDPHGVYKLVIDNAIDNLREAGIMPPWITFRYYYYHECYEYNSLGLMVDLSRTVDIDVMVGPPCTAGMVPLSLFGTYMDILSLGYVSSGKELADKTLFKYLARFYPTQNQLMHGVMSITTFYGWQQVAVIRLDSDIAGCDLVGTAFDELLKSNLVIVNYMVTIDLNQKNFTNLLLEVRNRARIIIMCNSYKYATKPDLPSTRDVLIEADRLGMVSPQYVWLIIQPVNRHIRSPPWKLHFATEPDLQEEQAIRAYRSAIIITPEGSNEINLRPIDRLTLRAWNTSIYDLKHTYLKIDGMVASSIYDSNIIHDVSQFEQFVVTIHPSRRAVMTWVNTICEFAVPVGDRLVACPLMEFSDHAMQFPFLNDVIYHYGTAINKSIEANNQTVNLTGSNLIRQFRCITFEGYSGTVSLDRFAERIPSYTLFSLDENEELSLMGVFQGYVKDCDVSNDIDFTFVPIREHLWRTGPDNVIPLDEPKCGFEGERCKDDQDWLYYVIAGAFTTFLVVGFFLVRWKKRRDDELEIYGVAWKVPPTDIRLHVEEKLKSHRSIQSIQSIRSVKSLRSIRSGIKESFVGYETMQFDEYSQEEWDAVYQHNANIKLRTYLKQNDCDLDRENLVILKHLRHLNHENLSGFRGLCLDHKQTIAFLWQPAERGNLEDLIFAHEINLDTVFKTSMIRDLTKGLDYLHRSDIGYHGELTALSCVVSSRWIVRIQNSGALRIVRNLVHAGQLSPQRKDTKVMLHMSPEVLRNETLTIDQWQQSDIYALAMVMYQIISRESLFFEESGSPDDLISKIIHSTENSCTRPKMATDVSEEQKLLEGLLRVMWHENPIMRPDISDVKSKVNLLMKGYSKNIMDHMLLLMEKYTDNLENIVKERTHQIEEENKKSEALLCQLLPPSIASDLKKGLAIIPESFDCVTIFFSDIVGFTNTCSLCTPIQVVTMLNTLFSLVDKTVSRFDVYKVETIGDSYLIVSGLPIRNGDRHVQEIPSMALAIRDGLGGYVIPHLSDRKIQMRFGIHTGSVAAGVIGSVMPRYCLFGDTVNLASRMESTSEAMKIQITEETKDLAVRTAKGLFEITYRGEIQMKGKGNRTTYWLDRAIPL